MKKSMWFKNNLPKIKAGFTIFVIVLAFFVSNLQVVKAMPPQLTVTTADVPRTIGKVVSDIWTKTKELWVKFGEKAFNATLRTTLQRIAFDAAKYVGTAREGQKPLFVTEGLETYLTNLGDAAAGDFIDSLGKTWAVDLCQPADPMLRARIGLGLINSQRPSAPNCTLSQIANNYTSIYEKYAAMKSGDFLQGVLSSFDPGGSEISASFELFNRTAEKKTAAADTAKTDQQISGGWLDVRDIAGKRTVPPGTAQADLASAQAKIDADFVKTGNDPWISAANVFLNQLALEAFQRAQRELTKGKSVTTAYNYNRPEDLFTATIDYGEAIVKEKLASVIKPHFDVKSNYSVLSELVTCPDKSNPGPTNCVIDDNFSQAIAEKVTVREALDKGYLHKDWLITDNDKLENIYTLRSFSILRKFRIVPVGWEQAIMASVSSSTPAQFRDLVSCFDLYDDYKDYSGIFDQTKQDWCKGLVDPSWVLKTPLGICRKQGAGGQVLSTFTVPNPNGLTTIAISRNDYCADEQTCIKEKNDGSCETYGYCNEEKRTWNFDSDSCEPIYNTCQTFTNNSNDQKVSYLENTLDYGKCDASNAGCKQYVYGGTYNEATQQVAWDQKYSIYFNNQVASCNSKDEGCTTFLRGKPGWYNVNYVMNSDFSANAIGDSLAAVNLKWPVAATSANIVTYGGSTALLLEGSNVKVYSDSSDSLLPKGMAVIPGWSYTLSADVYLETGSKVVMSFSEDNLQAETAVTGSWQNLKVSAVSGEDSISDLKFSISGLGAAKMYVKNIQLAPNDIINAYASYGVRDNVQTEKIIPAYLESACYASINTGVNDYKLKNNYPAICDNFARKCNKEEVGCNSFKSAKDGFVVAAKANLLDYCNPVCANYDTYIAREAYFFNTSADNLIPEKTKTCSAQSAGCASFTNLDEISQGGEKQDYYTYIRQCIKPNTADCGDFYSWEGTSGAGYQLKAVSLKKDNTGNPALVDFSAPMLAACTKEIYYLPTTDPRYNPDCREFYNKNGSITYSLITNTFSCSDNCHPYRLNEKNIDKNLDITSCVNTNAGQQTKHWDAGQGACYVCKNGGLWDDKYSACIYNSIPDEGTTCVAAEIGCREYNGNGGDKLRRIVSYDFEANLDPFTANSGVSQSIESTAKDGHSLAYGGGTLVIDAQNLVKKGSAYVIKFMAKAATPVTFNALLESSDSAQAIFNISDLNKSGDLLIKGGNSWNLYEINVTPIANEIKTEKLKIKISGALFIDNFVINEITDRYYLIKGTSQTPDECYYDLSIPKQFKGPNYNLGCSLYTDKTNTPHYLHRFSELCQDSAVGCEQMIETNNSINPFARNINLDNLDNLTLTCRTGDANCLSVPGHKITYAVYNPAKACLKEDSGCTRFAYSQATASSVNWIDAYKKNLPDYYTTTPTLCQSDQVGCEKWTYGEKNLESYFKNPGNNVCVYRANSTNNDYAWFKAAVKRCDNITVDKKISGAEQFGGIGHICSTDAECGTKMNCIIDTNDYTCDVNYFKTIGNGGSNGAIPTPRNRVGLCETTSAGCSEFIDPVSKHMDNIITAAAIIKMRPNSLYILHGPAILNSFTAPQSDSQTGFIRILDKTNNLVDQKKSIISSGAADIIFHNGVNSVVTVTNTTPNFTTLKEAIINYKINTDLKLDACNGVVDTENGCVLFNSRNRAAGPLKFDAAGTLEKAASRPCSSADCSANQIIKVRPDRICSRWLTCTSYIEDPVTRERVCYEMGECDKLDENGECDSVISGTPPSVRAITVGSNLVNKNATGYALLNNYYLGSMREVGQNADAHFDFEDGNAILTCKRLIGAGPCDEKFLKDSLILEPPSSGSANGIDYPAHGKGYLKVLSYYKISPLSEGSFIYVYGNQDYYINYLVNTTNSADQAKLVITDEIGTVIASSTNKTDSGWERKIFKFNVPSNNNNPKKIRIYLTSDTSLTQNSYVYFDDINIEPVLEVAPNQYVAKDCRLYPGTDSLTCLSSNNNVVKDGLFGYCLQYDPLNPRSCLMWYPIDKIAPITRSAQADLGYKGKFPLYYCSEVNGDFQVVEKIRPFEVHNYWRNDFEGFDSMDTLCKQMGGINCTTVNQCFISSQPQKNDGVVSIGYFNSNEDQKYPTCGSDNYRLMFNAIYAGKHYWLRIYCVPNPTKVLARTGEDSSKSQYLYAGQTNCSPEDIGDAWVPFDGKFAKGSVYSAEKVNGVESTENRNFSESVDDLAINDNIVNFSIGNLKPFTSNDPENSYRLTCNRFSQLVNPEGGNMAWVDRVSNNSLFPTSTPTFFYNKRADFSYFSAAWPPIASIKKPGAGCQGDADCLPYEICGGETGSCQGSSSNPPCSVLPIQGCSYVSGCSWVVVSAKKCIVGSSGNNLNAIYAYGRNREDVPFGGAVLPSDYTLVGSQPINLRNQYSAKNSETIFAGRPYGCKGIGCSNIGQCNLNPNIFCIYTENNELNKQSCSAGGGGECARLWETPLTATSSPNILSTLFIKEYADYYLNDGSYSNTGSVDWYAPPMMPVCSTRPNTHPESFCRVLPIIATTTMSQVLGKNSFVNIPINGLPTADQTVIINKNGLYKLSFNTQVDKEQQPLRQVIIDWGDSAGVQIISGLDNKPNPAMPHEFFHYYLAGTTGTNSTKTIGVRIIDNWDMYKGVGTLR